VPVVFVPYWHTSEECFQDLYGAFYFDESTAFLFSKCCSEAVAIAEGLETFPDARPGSVLIKYK
jgi:hypothetical protein